MAARPPALAVPSLSAAAHGAVLAAAGISAAPHSAAALAAPIRPEKDRLLVGESAIPVRYEVAFERVSSSIAAVNDELQRNYDELRNEVRGWNRGSIVCAAIGAVIIAVAVAILIFGGTTTGIVTTAASVIPNGASALFFLNARRANERLDVVTLRLGQSREAYALIEITETIDDVTLRNQLKAEIVRKRLA